MNWLDIGNRPLSWVLQQWCHRFLTLSESDAFAVQLSSGTATFRDVLLKTDAINEYPLPYGLEVLQGYISRAELQIHDWSNLKVSIKIETLSLTVQFAAPRPSQRFGMEDTDASSGFSSLIPIQVLLKWLMMNLTVSAEHISVHLKTESVHTLQCDCRQASYKQVQSEATSEPGFQFQTSSIEFAVMNSASQSSTIARFLNVEELNAVLGTSEDDRMHIDLRAKVIRSILDPETLSLLKKLASTIKKRKKAYQEDFDVVMEDAESVAESVFYDVETSSKASSFHSAFSNSTFFDCDESDNFSPREPMKPIEFVLAVDLSETILRSNSNSENRFQLFLNGLACKGIWGEVSDIEVAVNWMRLVDISQEASSMQYCDSQAQIPDRLRLLMASREVNSTSYVQFGFRAMRNCDGLNAMIHLESQKNKIEMRSAAFVFEIGCASIRRLSVVMKSIKSAFSSKHISNDGSSDDHIEFIWTTNLICGSLKRPNLERQSSSFFFIEMIPDPGSPLIVSKDLRDHRWGYSAAIMETTSLSIVSLHMFHCVCEDDRIVDCRHILAFKAPPRSPLSNGNALTIDFTRVIQQLSSRYDLSKMAYDLIAMYSDRDIESFQDRTLYRVGYEEKCMNTADNILQIGLGIVEFHICLDDLEVFMDILLEFWRPSKMEDQMKTKPDRQTICILNGFQIAGRLHPSENVSSIPLECQLNEIEILMVMSLQRRSISTSAVTLGDFEIKAPENDMLFKMGGEGNESPCLQFFQVSELDFRNARFKQWTALHQRKLSIQINPSISALRPTLQWMQNWMGRHRDCLQTDIEVEYFTFLNDEHLSVAYSASPETSLNFCIERVSSISENTIKLLIDVKNLEAFLLTESSNPYKFTTEPQWSCQFKRDKDRNIEIEIRNQHLSINLNPNALKGLCQLGQSLIDVFPSSNEEERSESMDEMQSFMSNISTDAFASKNEASQSNQASMSYSPYQRMEEDEDGFVVVEDLLKEKDSTCLRNSSTTWLNGSALDIHDEYIVLPQIENEGSTSLLPDLQTTNNPSSGFALKFMDLSVACFLEAENSEHLDIIAKDVQIAFISFVPGSLYRNRLSVSIQEFEVLDGFSGEEGRKIVERTKSQLRTGCSRQMENNTTGFPMIQISIETVLPDVHLAKTTEKRFDLRIVPLRLRLSQELNAFCKPFKNAISIPTLSSSSEEECFFQMCTVSEFYVVVDYRPLGVNFKRLKSGRTGELVNAVQWEGLEFFLNKIKLAGVSEWDRLCGSILQSWTYDIYHAEGRHLLTGFPTLGVFKRVSPAAHDVLQAALSKIAKHETIKVDVRGAHVTESPSLTRAMSEFGRVCSLEFLNLCSYGTEGFRLIVDGIDAPPAPTNTRNALHQAGTTLRHAADAVISNPIRSVRSGEGLGVAMTKALWAVPKAILAPASAATTVLHGALKSACEKLDKEHVLNA